MTRLSHATHGCRSLMLALLLCGGCTTIPPEAVVAQKLLAKNIEVARHNQLSLIDQYAEDQKAAKRLEYQHIALPAVLKSSANKDGAVTADDASKLILEYSTDLQGDLDGIDVKARSLREQTNKGFDLLSQLAMLNQEYIDALKTRSDRVSQLFGKYQRQLDGLQKEFAETLQAAESRQTSTPIQNPDQPPAIATTP